MVSEGEGEGKEQWSDVVSGRRGTKGQLKYNCPQAHPWVVSSSGCSQIGCFISSTLAQCLHCAKPMG